MRKLWCGAAVVFLLAVFIMPLLALLVRFSPFQVAGLTFSDRYFWHVMGFTFGQALLSMVISVVMGIGVARALARRPDFPGRQVLLALLSLPVVMPTIVAVFGIIAIFGYQGWLNQLAVWVGMPRWGGLYGLAGILIIHAFFNVPLCVRLLLPLWEREPQEYWRLSAQLGMRGGAVWRLVEWPMLKPHLPGMCALITLLCAGSFAAVLTLGGGPNATTLPVYIYQSLRFDADLPTASLLALVQLVIGVLFLLLLPSLDTRLWLQRAGVLTHVSRADAHFPMARLQDALWLSLAALLLLAPTLSLVMAGLAGPVVGVLISADFLAALEGSLMIALLSVLIAVGVGMPLALVQARPEHPLGRRVITGIGQMGLAISPLALGTGWFVLLRGSPGWWGTLLLIALVNGMMGIPYLLRLLVPALSGIHSDYGHLTRQLGMPLASRIKYVAWPLVRKPLATAMALIGCLSLGDFGVVALFGNPQLSTLPLLLYRQLGAYRSSQAAVTALLLLVLIGVVFWALDRGLGGKASTQEGHA